jgi:hypothetical protein
MLDLHNYTFVRDLSFRSACKFIVQGENMYSSSSPYTLFMCAHALHKLAIHLSPGKKSPSIYASLVI